MTENPCQDLNVSGLAAGYSGAVDRLIDDALAIFNALPEAKREELMAQQRQAFARQRVDRLEEVKQEIAARRRPEREDFMLEAALHQGFTITDEDGEAYAATADQVVALVKAAHQQGIDDVRGSRRPAEIAHGVRKVRDAVSDRLPSTKAVLERIAQEVERLNVPSYLEQSGREDRLLKALDRFELRVLSKDVEPRDDDTWGLIDTATADPDTNWPGELMSEHPTHAAARRALMTAILGTVDVAGDFQARCQKWLDVVTEGDPTDRDERIARFYEEATELVQALGMSRAHALELVYYTFSRPAGEPAQEYGGTSTTLAVLAEHTGHDLLGCGERELARVWKPEVIEKIRGKRSRRHGRGPLPGTVEADLVPAGGLGDQPRAFNDFRYAD